MYEVYDQHAPREAGNVALIKKCNDESDMMRFIRLRHPDGKITIVDSRTGKRVSIDGDYAYFVTTTDKPYRPDMTERITLHVTCHKCEKVTGVPMTQAQAIEYCKPERSTVMSIFPGITDATHKLLTTGICPKCW
jgi:stress response protein SCP2